MKKALSTIVLFALLASCLTWEGDYTGWWKDEYGPKLKVGMPVGELLGVLPRPYEINRTVLKNTIHEQWIYKRPMSGGYVYLYLENDVLEGWQD